MTTTFGDLKTEVAAALRDPDGRTFDDTALGRLVNAGLSRAGRVLPYMFQEDISPVADTLEYVVQSDVWSGEANADIEVMRVEIWDGSQTPNTRLKVVSPASAGVYMADSQNGWTNWGGTLSLPWATQQGIAGHEDDYLIRVWGYSPYPQLVYDEDTAALTSDGYWLVVTAAQIEGLKMLNNDRNLFSQWQTRPGNSDISPAGLLSELNAARDEWRRMQRELLRLRSTV